MSLKGTNIQAPGLCYLNDSVPSASFPAKILNSECGAGGRFVCSLAWTSIVPQPNNVLIMAFQSQPHLPIAVSERKISLFFFASLLYFRTMIVFAVIDID